MPMVFHVCISLFTYCQNITMQIHSEVSLAMSPIPPSFKSPALTVWEWEAL